MVLHGGLVQVMAAALARCPVGVLSRRRQKELPGRVAAGLGHRSGEGIRQRHPAGFGSRTRG